jgi:competence protein ComEA
MKTNRILAGGLVLALAALVSTASFAAQTAPAKPASSARSTRAARVRKAATAGKVNLNTASGSELSALPGVGEKLATRIVEHRQKTGGFKSTHARRESSALLERPAWPRQDPER